MQSSTVHISILCYLRPDFVPEASQPVLEVLRMHLCVNLAKKLTPFIMQAHLC